MKKFLGNREHGLIFVMSAPAGTGKNTLLAMLLEEFPEQIVESLSITTRPRREGEEEGKHYHFVSDEEFDAKIAAGEMLESVELFDYRYGTTRAAVEELTKKGKHVFLVIDAQGACTLLDIGFDAVYIFVHPPSLSELSRRLRARSTDAPEMIEKRLEWSAWEIEQAPRYDYELINDDLQTAYQILRSILIAEEHRTGEKS